MAAAAVVPGATRTRKRSFFFALSRDQREFVFRGANKERLVMSTLSLGFGARDEVHVLEAEGANADREKNVNMLVQTTAMLGVQPSLPAVTLNSTVLALPVTFKLRSGPGPLYVSGSHLEGIEEAGAAATETAKNLTTAPEEPVPKRASIFAEPLVAKVEQKVSKPVSTLPWGFKDSALSTPAWGVKDSALSTPAWGFKDSALAMFAAKYCGHGASTSSSVSPAVTGMKTDSEGKEPDLLKYYNQVKENNERRYEKTLESVKAKMMESVHKGVRLSVVKQKFERFLEHCHNVTDPKMVAELWNWRQRQISAFPWQ